MGNLQLINKIMAFFLILMAFMGLRTTYDNAQRYGWTYTQTTIIGEEVTETVISFGSQAFATLFLGVLGILLLSNSRMGGGYILEMKPLKEGDITGITFPQGDPDHWDLAIDLRTRIVDVTLNDFKISFPLSTLTGWVEQYDKKKLEDTK